MEKKKRRKSGQYAKKNEFSKTLLIQESILIWIITLAFIILAFICVSCGYFGELPWLTGMVGFPWAAYGTSQVFYYNKASKENSKGGIKYDSVMAELMTKHEESEGAVG